MIATTPDSKCSVDSCLQMVRKSRGCHGACKRHYLENYRKDPLRKEKIRIQTSRWAKTPRGMECARERSRRYISTDKSKLARKIYAQSPSGIAAHKKAIAKYSGTYRQKFATYRHGAAKRGLTFELSGEEFASFWGKPCFYCASDVKTVGIDRLDNSIGYSLANTVPCCTVCNRMKLTYSKEFFISHCQKIVSASI